MEQRLEGSGNICYQLPHKHCLVYNTYHVSHSYNKLQTWVRIITAFCPLQLNKGLFSQHADNTNFSIDRVLTLKSKQCSSGEGTCWIQSQSTIPMMVMVVIQRTVIIRLCLGSNQFHCGRTLFWVWIARIAFLTRRLCLQWRVRVAFVLPNGKFFMVQLCIVCKQVHHTEHQVLLQEKAISCKLWISNIHSFPVEYSSAEHSVWFYASMFFNLTHKVKKSGFCSKRYTFPGDCSVMTSKTTTLAPQCSFYNYFISKDVIIYFLYLVKEQATLLCSDVWQQCAKFP